mgnify:CR=1 FL=1
MVAHGGESPTRKANARRHVAHAAVISKQFTNRIKLEYENKSLKNVKTHHLCYMHKSNKQSYAMAMIAFGCEVFKSAKHVEDLPLLKSFFMNQNEKTGLSQEAITETPKFILETLIDWVKIIICFENFMKASLLINDYVIHNIDKNDKILKCFQDQRNHPLKLQDFLLRYNFSYCITDKTLMLEGITPQTLTMSSLLSKKYQKIINLPESIYKTLMRLNNERNNLHFYHEARNSYGKKYFEEMDELVDFVDNVMMNLFGHLMKNVQQIKKQRNNDE